jgi:hypothetical protein
MTLKLFPLTFIFLLLAGLGLFITACRNHSPTSSSSSTPVPVRFTIQNNLAPFTVLQISYLSYPSGINYVQPLSVLSGATTILNTMVPAGTYFVNVYANNNEFDSWSPVIFTSGSSFSITVNGSTDTLNSAPCNTCYL